MYAYDRVSMFVNIVDLDFYLPVSITLVLLVRMFVNLCDAKRWGRVSNWLASSPLLLLRRTFHAQSLSVFHYVSLILPSSITNVGTVGSNVRESLRRETMGPRVQLIGFQSSPITTQNIPRSVIVCLSLRKLNYFRALLNENFSQ